jgi:hypothetical protein
MVRAVQQVEVERGRVTTLGDVAEDDPLVNAGVDLGFAGGKAAGLNEPRTAEMQIALIDQRSAFVPEVADGIGPAERLIAEGQCGTGA